MSVRGSRERSENSIVAIRGFCKLIVRFQDTNIFIFHHGIFTLYILYPFFSCW